MFLLRISLALGLATIIGSHALLAETPWEAYLANPTAENAAAVDSVSYSDGSTRVFEERGGKDLAKLRKRVQEGDSSSVDLGFRLLITCEDFLGVCAPLDEMLGDLIRSKPTVFLSVMGRYRRVSYKDYVFSNLVENFGPDFTDNLDAQYVETEARIKSLKKVPDPDLKTLRDEFVEALEGNLVELLEPIVRTAQISSYHTNQVNKWRERFEGAIDKFKEENVRAKYRKFDFSPILAPTSDFLGFIGPDFRRLRIKFDTVKKDSAVQDQYRISGYSIVEDNKCNFEGVIKVRCISEYSEMEYGVDDTYRDSGMQCQGNFIGEYVLTENENQEHAGVFEGIVFLGWYVDREGHLRYDDISLGINDSYANNQYVGTWRQHNGKKMRVANWGEWRIPFSGDLDVGAGEFSVNPKYYSRGWQDFKEQ